MTSTAEWIARFARIVEQPRRPLPTRWVAFFELDDGTYTPIGRTEGSLSEAVNEAIAQAMSRVMVRPEEEGD